MLVPQKIWMLTRSESDFPPETTTIGHFRTPNKNRMKANGWKEEKDGWVKSWQDSVYVLAPIEVEDIESLEKLECFSAPDDYHD